MGETLPPDVPVEPLDVEPEVVPLLDSDELVLLLEQAAADVTHAAAVTPTATAAMLR
jgi:hypothetical protein